MDYVMQEDASVPGYRIPSVDMGRVRVITGFDASTGRPTVERGVAAVEYVMDELLDDHWARAAGTADAAVYESTVDGHGHAVTLDRDRGEMTVTLRYDGEHGTEDPFLFDWDGYVRDVEARLRGERAGRVRGPLTADPVHEHVEHAMRKR